MKIIFKKVVKLFCHNTFESVRNMHIYIYKNIIGSLMQHLSFVVVQAHTENANEGSGETGSLGVLIHVLKMQKLEQAHIKQVWICFPFIQH